MLGHGFPLSDALLQFHYVHPSNALIKELLPELAANFEDLKKQRQTETPLYWSKDGGWQGCGGEVSISGAGIRPTFSSYCYAQARALAKFYALQGDMKRSISYSKEAELIASHMMELLWDDEANFFKVMRTRDIPSKKLANVRNCLVTCPGTIPYRQRRKVTKWPGSN